MSEVWLIIKEQIKNFRTILHLSRYEEKATYQSHYLGILWQIINPIIQVGIYYVVFGLGVYGGRKIEGTPFLVWMLIGIIVWFFVNRSIIGASNSIYKQVNLVSRMKFPVSILPMNSIVSNLSSYFPMMGFLMIMFIIFGVHTSIYWIQYFYYFICMIAFLFAMGLLNATITTMIRDYHIILQSVMRFAFYVSGPIWDIQNRNLPPNLVKLLKLNPIYYLIEGFRDSFLSRQWFWEKGTFTMIFWGMTLIILIVGSHIHLKFRNRFIDMI